MNITIIAENGVEFEVCGLGVAVVDHGEETETWARLSAEQRRALAAALDPAREQTPAGGEQWTRDDFARLDIHPLSPAGEVIDQVVAWLNAHHPKPEPDRWRSEWVAVSEDLKAARRQSDLAHEQWKKWEDRARRAECERDAAVARAEQAERERDEWKQEHDLLVVHGSVPGDTYAAMVRDRDDWRDKANSASEGMRKAMSRAEKAEQLIPAYAMLDIWMALGRDSIHFDDWYDEHGYADAWAELTAAVREERGDLDAARENAKHYQAMFDATERQRDEWKARAEAAEARTTPAVTREQVEAVVGDSPSYAAIADRVCDMLGIEDQPDPLKAYRDHARRERDRVADRDALRQVRAALNRGSAEWAILNDQIRNMT